MGVLHLDLGLPAQNTDLLAEGIEKWLKSDSSLLWRKAKRNGAVQPGEEKALGRLYCSLSIYKGEL